MDDEHQYKNWVRGAKGLELLQDGLKGFVGDKAPVCRDQQLQNILGYITQCNQCTSQNLLPDHANGKTACNNDICIEQSSSNCFGNKPKGRRKCPKGICSKLYDAIVWDHRYRCPLWKGTDPRTWCSDPLGWSFAHCFQTTTGPETSAQDTDAAGLLSFIINSLSMQNWLACNHMGSKTMCAFQKARDIRNEILHKAKMELDDQTLDGYLDIFIAVLQDSKYLVTCAESQETVYKLTQLKSKQIHISQRDETRIRKMREEALFELEEKTQEALKQIEDAASAGMTNVNKTKTDAMQRIMQTAFSRICDVNTQKAESLHEMKRAKITALSDIDRKRKGAIHGIKTTSSIGVSVVKKKKTNSLCEIKEATTSGLSDVNKTKADAVKVIKSTTSSGVLDLNRKKTEAMQEIEEAKKNIVEEVIYKRQHIEISQPDGRKLTPSPDEHYSMVISGLQDDLIFFYMDQHGTISMSPLIEKETPVLEFYVIPEIYSVNARQTCDGVKEYKSLVTPLRNVFYKENKICRKIYLTADAGLGKTAFSKRLALTWCIAKGPRTTEEQFFSQEEIEAMHEFRFVFLLLLRDSSTECDIDDLIWTQIVSQLPRPHKRENLEKILFKENCLVILDGLDEWCHPSFSCKHKKSSIPHRKVRKQTTVLTTTRPWKLSVSGLHSSEIDKKLELTGLNEKSANALKKSVISHLFAGINDQEAQKKVEGFTRDLEEKQISDLETVPLFLIYLLYLWCNKIELGQSQCDLYSQITELLLTRTVQNYHELIPKVDLHLGNIPQCLRKQTHCTKYYSILKALGRLAYQTLFKENGEENALVFDSSLAGHYLNKEWLAFCLKTGIITQSKVPGTLLPQESKVSFTHKTVQEFFAALYIRSAPDQTLVPEIVLSKCKCVEDILEMSTTLIFLSGLNVNVLSLISRELMNIINEDKLSYVHRNRSGGNESLKQFQDICISCCKELPQKSIVNIYLQDIFIDKSCQQDQYPENLKQLTTRNKLNIRSLFVDMNSAPYSSAQEVIEYFALRDVESIEKIRYRGEYNDHDILPLLKRSVKSISLLCYESAWSGLLYEKVISLQNLAAIFIYGFKMSHRQLTLLCDYISQRHSMREFGLWRLRCIDHEESCPGCSLDLSQRSQLKAIRLDDIYVLELSINMSSLEECYLHKLSNPDLVLRFLNCVSTNSRVNTFECWDLKSSAAIDAIQQTLPLLMHVKDVTLWEISLGYGDLLTSAMVDIESIDLRSVKMPASVLRGIITVLQKLPQKVTVYMQWCYITPENGFENVVTVAEIKQSPKFRVIEDSEGMFSERVKFETIKDGD